MLASNPEIVPLAYSLFLHPHFFQSGISPKKGYMGVTMGGVCHLEKNGGGGKERTQVAQFLGRYLALRMKLVSFVMTKIHW